MSKYLEKDIPLTQLDLDLENSRYTWVLESQREIIEWMMRTEEQQRKGSGLAIKHSHC